VPVFVGTDFFFQVSGLLLSALLVSALLVSALLVSALLVSALLSDSHWIVAVTQDFT